jgi:hypothetical protein
LWFKKKVNVGQFPKLSSRKIVIQQEQSPWALIYVSFSSRILVPMAFFLCRCLAWCWMSAWWSLLFVGVQRLYDDKYKSNGFCILTVAYCNTRYISYILIVFVELWECHEFKKDMTRE